MESLVPETSNMLQIIRSNSTSFFTAQKHHINITPNSNKRAYSRVYQNPKKFGYSPRILLGTGEYTTTANIVRDSNRSVI